MFEDPLFRYHIWLKVRYVIGVFLMVLIFVGAQYLLKMFGVNPRVVTATSLIIMLVSAALAWMATEPLERRLFGDTIEFVPLRPWLRVTVTVLLLIGAALVAFETYSSY